MKKPKKQTTVKQDIGKLLLDLGKLLFGGIFIGGILREDFSHLFLIISGFGIGIIFCVVGLILGIRETKNGSNTD